jgi:predicted RNA-binding Zn-ribbon protein involved in translation (DUF1610 family)
MSDEKKDTPSTRRCTICALSLPNVPAWAKCPKCGEKTDIIGNVESDVTEQEAASLLRAREFEEYLEKEGIE